MFNISDLYVCKKCKTCEKLDCVPLCKHTLNSTNQFNETEINCAPGYTNPPTCRTVIPATSYTNDQIITLLNNITGPAFGNNITNFLQQVPISYKLTVSSGGFDVVIKQLSSYVVILKTNSVAPYTYVQVNGNAFNSFPENSVMSQFKSNITSSNMGDLVDVTQGAFWWNNNGIPNNSPGYIDVNYMTGELKPGAWVQNDSSHNQAFFPHVVRIDDGFNIRILGVLLIGPIS